MISSPKQLFTTFNVHHLKNGRMVLERERVPMGSRRISDGEFPRAEAQQVRKARDQVGQAPDSDEFLLSGPHRASSALSGHGMTHDGRRHIYSAVNNTLRC